MCSLFLVGVDTRAATAGWKRLENQFAALTEWGVPVEGLAVTLESLLNAQHNRGELIIELLHYRSRKQVKAMLPL